MIEKDKLPDINFVDTDSKNTLDEIIKNFSKLVNRDLKRSDPLYLVLETFANYLLLQKNLINFSAKQNLLAYATDGYIEHLGALYGLERLQATNSMTTLRFELADTNQHIIINKDTRVTSGDRNFFKTIKTVDVPPNTTSVDVIAISTDIGEKNNNYKIGEINKIVDSFPYFISVKNIDIPNGGTDKEDIEKFRERISNAPNSFSVAGSEKSYIHWTKTVSNLISDVSITSPTPGEVIITPLLHNGKVPSEELIEKIYNTCNAEDIRPLTDLVKVQKPEIVNFNIDITYFIKLSDSNINLTIQQNIAKSIENFLKWQTEKLGRDINDSQLIKFVVSGGAKRVEVREPKFTKLAETEIAKIENINIIFGGFESD